MNRKVQVALGVLCGLTMAGLLGLVGSGVKFLLVKKTVEEVHSRELLQPVLVAARDISAGSTLATDDMAMREIPARLVTTSVITPDSANYVVGQSITVPIRTGDALQWAFLIFPS